MTATGAVGVAVASAPAAALELCGIDVRYGARFANRGVSLRVEPGTVHAVVGENGAGKSTLLGVAYGEVRAAAGRLVVHGREAALVGHTPARAIALGLGMVHQHFMLVPTLTVVENVILGREPRRGPLVDLSRAEAELATLAAAHGLALDPRALVETLSVGERQRVEIAKVLFRGAEVLLFDEPTAVLGPSEVGAFLRALRGLAERGKTVVLVTHKLDEVAAVADAVTVLRHGERVVSYAQGSVPAPELIARAIIGREPPPPLVPPPVRDRGAPVLTARGLISGSSLLGVDLELRAGEILGLAGVEGNGQAELVLALARLSACAGEIVRAPGALGHIPADRHRHGLVADFTLAENLTLGRQRELSGRVTMDRARVLTHARELLARFDVRPGEPDLPVRALSGGNQQKLVVARELSRPGLTVLLCAHPTRGVDLAAADTIRRALVEARAAGVGVLLISSDLGELRALSDRIAVLVRGRIVATLARDAATEEALGALMTAARESREPSA